MNRLNDEQVRLWEKAFAYYCKTGKWLLNWENDMYGLGDELRGLHNDIKKLSTKYKTEIARLKKLNKMLSEMNKLYKDDLNRLNARLDGLE